MGGVENLKPKTEIYEIIGVEIWIGKTLPYVHH